MKYLGLLILVFFCFRSDPISSQNAIDCNDFKVKILNAFSESNSFRISSRSPSDHLKMEYEIDSTKNWHIIFNDYSKENTKFVFVGIGKITYFSESEVRIWGTELPVDFVYQKQISFLKNFNRNFERNFTNCVQLKEPKSSSSAFNIYTFQIEKDTFRAIRNKTTGNFEKISGVISQTEFKCVFDLPLKMIEPTREASNDVNFGYTFFPPIFVESDENEGDEPVYVLPEKKPEYRNGYQELIKILSENIKYPRSAKNAGIQGTVYVGFIIEKDGSMSDLKIKRTVDKSLDNEALRVVKLLGNNWIPGKNGGQNVKCSYVLPIKFEFK